MDVSITEGLSVSGVGGKSYPWNAKYKNMKKIPKPFPTRFLVPAYSAVIAARQEVVTTIPMNPVMNMPLRELTLS